MSKLTLIQRQQAVELFEQGYGYVLVSRMLKLNQSQVELLSRMWRIHGKLCLMRRKNKHYPFETKKEVVTRYLQGDNPIEPAETIQHQLGQADPYMGEKMENQRRRSPTTPYERIPTSKRYWHTTDRGRKTPTR